MLSLIVLFLFHFALTVGDGWQEGAGVQLADNARLAVPSVRCSIISCSTFRFASDILPN